MLLSISVCAVADDWVSHYYEHPTPERFIKEVRALNDAGVLSSAKTAAPLAVFLGRVMAANPDQAGVWLTQLNEVKSPGRDTLLLAASLSGTKTAMAYLRKQTDSSKYLKDPVDPRKMEPDQPVVLDMLWADFFATGDSVPIRRIVYALNYDKYLGALERYKSSKKTQQDRDEALRESVFEAARWSLESNIQQHKRVAMIVEGIFLDGQITQPERVWLAAVLSKALPEKYELAKKQPGEWTLERRK